MPPTVRCLSSKNATCARPCQRCGSCNGCNCDGGDLRSVGESTGSGVYGGGGSPIIFAPQPAAPIIIQSPPVQQPRDDDARCREKIVFVVGQSAIQNAGENMPAPIAVGTYIPENNGTSQLPITLPSNGSGELMPSSQALNPVTPVVLPGQRITGTNDDTKTNPNGQPIIINITNSQDRDSRNRSMYSPEILDSYNAASASGGRALPLVVRANNARRVPVRDARLLRLTPGQTRTSHAPSATPHAGQVESENQLMYHYVGWS